MAWKQDSTGWWWQNDDGSYPASAWKQIDGVWYYFNSSGYMVTGWQQIGGSWYYFDSSGAMKTGWLSDGGKWYYLNSDGVMLTGTHTIDGTSYTFNSDGSLQENKDTETHTTTPPAEPEGPYTATVSLGSAGNVLGNGSWEAISAQGENKAIKVTRIQVDWNDRGAYILSSDSTNRYYVNMSVTSGSTSVWADRWSRKSDSETARPSIDVTPNIECPNNTAVYFNYSHDNYTGIKNLWYVYITYYIIDNSASTITYTDCGPPSVVNVSRARSTAYINWGAGSGGDNNPITGYTIFRNTSQSDSGATEIGSVGSTTTSTSNAPGNGTFYYGVRTNGDHGNSGIKWGGSVYIYSHPTVSSGSTITKAQMDALKAYINGSQTSASQYSTITEVVADTYSNVNRYTTATASWYNNA